MARKDTGRKLIIENLVTTLEGITIASGKNTTVRRVEKVLRHWDEVRDDERPWVGFLVGRESYEYLPGLQIRCLLPIRMLAYIKITKDTDLRDQYTNMFLDDIIVAVNEDTTRGGGAVSTTIKTVETDEGDDETTGIIEFNLEVKYYRPFNTAF